jgi:peptidoglycan/xylan/chitin deacetylase (PgdA/CDA1 family)
VVVVVLLLLGWWLFTPASGAPDTVRAIPASANLQPTVAPTPIPGPLSVQPPRTFAAYLVAEGDTLEAIAARFGSDPVAIQRYNNLAPNVAPRAGQPLVLPIYRTGETPATVLPVSRGNTARPLVALTFDIELDDQSLLRILETLRQRSIRATFFLAGNWVKAYPDAARAIVKDGHELGNHSMTHPYFSRIGDNGVVSEISQLETLTIRTTGVTTKPYFRFPYGDYDGPLAELIARQGYVAYQWNVDDASIAGWLARAAQRPEDAYGSIILLHGRQSVAEELGAWVDRMKALGLRPTTLTEVLK